MTFLTMARTKQAGRLSQSRAELMQSFAGLLSKLKNSQEADSTC